ncbi:MAG: TAXI family TRAP transporter solute-binding subunit [Vicinamibacterales bacterium]
MQSLATVFRRDLPDIDVQMTPWNESGPSAMEDASVDLALTPASNAYFAYLDSITRDAPADGQVRAISALHTTPLLLAVRDSSAVSRVSDLRGHTSARILLLPPGELSEMEVAAVARREKERRIQRGDRPDTDRLVELVLHAFDVERFPARSLQVLPAKEALGRFSAGSLDAVWGTGYFTGDVIREATSRGARLVSIEGPAIDRLREEYPFIRPIVIPANSYPGQAAPVHTIGVDLLLVCRASLDEQLVHSLTRHYIAALGELSTSHPSLGLVDLELAAAGPIPLHDGAARYYRESELFR